MIPIRHVLPLTLLALLPPATAAAAAPMDVGFDAYIAEARAVVVAIDAGNAKALAPALTALATKADAMVGPFVARFPVCGDYLKATQALSASWPSLSLEQIEANFHRDGALPRIESAQDRALCYQMKDLLVHPLTGLRLLEEAELDVPSLRAEIAEVVSHGVALKALVAARSAN